MLRKLFILFYCVHSAIGLAQINDGQLNTLDNRYVDEYGDTAKIYTDEVEIELSDKTYHTGL